MNRRLMRTIAGLAIVCAFAGGVLAAPGLARSVPVIAPPPVIVAEYPIVAPQRDAYESKAELARDEDDAVPPPDASVDDPAPPPAASAGDAADADAPAITPQDDRPLPANIVGAPAPAVTPVAAPPPPIPSEAAYAPPAAEAPPPIATTEPPPAAADPSTAEQGDPTLFYPVAGFLYLSGRGHPRTHPTFQRPFFPRGRR